MITEVGPGWPQRPGCMDQTREPGMAAGWERQRGYMQAEGLSGLQETRVHTLALPPAGQLRQPLSSLCLDVVTCKEGECGGGLSPEPGTRQGWGHGAVLIVTLS